MGQAETVTVRNLRRWEVGFVGVPTKIPPMEKESDGPGKPGIAFLPRVQYEAAKDAITALVTAGQLEVVGA